MKILGLIPARGGSKGVPRKNIRLLNGKPLLAYSAEFARQSNLVHSLILSSEDEEVIAVGESLGIQVPFIRPKNLALDTTSSIDVIVHAIEAMQAKGEDFEWLCLLQPTSPFRRLNLLSDAVEKINNTGADSLISVRRVPAHFNPHWTFKNRSDEYLQVATGENFVIPRRQELPDAYYRDGQIYLSKTDVILKRKSLFGEKLTYVLNENEGSTINIDTVNDWRAAEQYLDKMK